MGRGVKSLLRQSQTCIKHIKELILLTCAVAITALLVYPQVVVSEASEVPYEVTVEQVKPIVQANEDIYILISQYAEKYGVSKEAMYGTIRNESGGTYNPTIQSRMRYGHISERWLEKCPDIRVGDQERSYGLAQIHICDHDVTIKQATDPHFALDFMARNFALGNQNMWMGYSDN